MKRFIFILAFMLTFGVVAHSAKPVEVTSVAGCFFGDAEQDVVNSLIDRFGNTWDSDDKSITFYDVTIGNTNYSVATFYFELNMKNQRKEFVAATLKYSTIDQDKARTKFKDIIASYSLKYANETAKREIDGTWRYGFGAITAEDIFPISISLSKINSYDWCIMVSYFGWKSRKLYIDDI